MHALEVVLSVVPAVETRTLEFPEGLVLSFVGPAKTIAKAMELFMVSEMLCFEQLVKFGISQKGSVIHVSVHLESSHVVLESQHSRQLCFDGFGYAHIVATMDHGVNIALFDQGFVPNLENGKAFGSFIAAVFKHSKVRGSNNNTLILSGISVTSRVLVASQNGRRNPLQAVGQKIENDCRYSVRGSNTLVATSAGTGQVHTLGVNDLVDALETGGIPVWKHHPL